MLPVYIRGSSDFSARGNKDIFLKDLMKDFFLVAFLSGGVGDAL